MKRYQFILVSAAIVLAIYTISIPDCTAQVPQSISYQAVVTDTAGNPLEGTIALKISIIQKSDTGKVVYIERHVKDTDKNGLVSLAIGNGDLIYKGEFDTIDWSAGPYFTKVEIAPNGGYLYPISTTSELMSVPFAMFALRADSVSSQYTEKDPQFKASVASGISAEDTLRWNALSKEAQFKIGDFHEGGIIFHIEPGGGHGLIASVHDVSNNAPWSPAESVTGAVSTFNGFENTSGIVASLGAGDYAAYLCDTLQSGGYNDWYLPAADELYLLFKARYNINKILEEDGNESTSGLKADAYWSSTEKASSKAALSDFGSIRAGDKNIGAAVRAIRSF